jgi:tRNA threonylcarbamoyladenosine biosynthesis protein TsaE
MEWIIENEQAMKDLGASFAKKAKPGNCYALIGNLGAGKTHWSKGFAKELGYTGSVTSPTFSIVQEYQNTQIPIIHIDLYRIKSETEALNLHWDDYLESDAILIVEWADLYPNILPNNTQIINIEILDSARKVTTELL